MEVWSGVQVGILRQKTWKISSKGHPKLMGDTLKTCSLIESSNLFGLQSKHVISNKPVYAALQFPYQLAGGFLRHIKLDWTPKTTVANQWWLSNPSTVNNGINYHPQQVCRKAINSILGFHAILLCSLSFLYLILYTYRRWFFYYLLPYLYS